jgi:hypothetical protein
VEEKSPKHHFPITFVKIKNLWGLTIKELTVKIVVVIKMLAKR